MAENRTPKRSRRVTLTTLTAASSVTLASCGSAGDWGDGSGAEGQVFQTVAECVGAGLAQNECEQAYKTALADNNNDAPRFNARDVCEEEFGSGGCQQQTDGTGSFWTPLLAGFVIANVVSGFDIDRRKRKYAPLYRNRSSGTWFYGGSNYGAMTPTSGGRYGFDPNTLNRPVSAPRVQSRADIASRGGFGGRASSRSSGGGWGS